MRCALGKRGAKLASAPAVHRAARVAGGFLGGDGLGQGGVAIGAVGVGGGVGLGDGAGELGAEVLDGGGEEGVAVFEVGSGCGVGVGQVLDCGGVGFQPGGEGGALAVQGFPGFGRRGGLG